MTVMMIVMMRAAQFFDDDIYQLVIDEFLGGYTDRCNHDFRNAKLVCKGTAHKVAMFST